MPSVTTERTGASAIIRYSNAPRHYLTAEGSAALLSTVQAASADTGIRAIIITGTDDVFIRHYDVKEIQVAGAAVSAGKLTPKDFEAGPFADLMGAIYEAPKPVIAAINGICMGGGFELALACDLRIAGATVPQIGLPETRIGIFPGGGGTQRLPRLIGEAKALEFILTGQVVAADEALALGLVHKVTANPLATATQMGSELAMHGADGLAHAKRLVRGALSMPLADGLTAEQHAFFEAVQSPGAVEGMQRFLDGGEDITQ